MSAIVCGKRRSFFDEDSSPPSVSKRLRCPSTSPVRFSPSIINPFSQSSSPSSLLPSQNSNPNSVPSPLHHLLSLFPGMEKELVERTFKECGNDLDSAIKSLNALCLGTLEMNSASAVAEGTDLPQQEVNAGNISSAEVPLPEGLPKNGSEWVELFVSEMSSSSTMDDARGRASRILEVLENSIRANVNAQAAENFQKENMMLKQKLEAVVNDNNLLKRAVAIQHERQKAYDGMPQQVQQLKQLVDQYREQLSKLEVANYALSMHLKQAQQNNSSMPSRFNPDIF